MAKQIMIKILEGNCIDQMSSKLYNWLRGKNLERNDLLGHSLSSLNNSFQITIIYLEQREPVQEIYRPEMMPDNPALF